MQEPLLRVQSLSKDFENLAVLKDISFQLNAGEVLGVVGRRGSGKSVLLETIGGVFAPSNGQIFVQGRDTRTETMTTLRRQGIELVTQNPKLVNPLDIIQNIFLGKEIIRRGPFNRPDWPAMYKIARDLLLEFDTPLTILSEKPANLTDEQQLVVTLAHVFCQPNKLLLLDDFLDALSYQRQQIVLNRIKKLAAQGAGIIITSENLKHLFSITNRIIVLYEGRLTAERITSECTPRDIVELIVGARDSDQVTPVIWALESYHAAQKQTEELFAVQAKLHKSLAASDSTNRKLVERLSVQVRALDRLNEALQETQRRLLTEREEERKSLARDLHDQVIQDLLSINYRLEEAECDNIPEDHRLELIGIRDGIRQVVSDLRQLCQELRPPTIDNHGLYSAISSLAQDWAERTGIDVELDIDPALGRLPEAIELSVFRIVQEGINNVAKHAAADKVYLTLQRTPMDSILVQVHDNGKGVAAPPDLANLSAEKHFGLVGISERAALLGGSMNIQSPDEGGLILKVEIPSPYPSG